MFHIELRHFPHTTSRFNLSEDELRHIVIPWVRDEWIEVGERKWNPQEAKLTILEGPTLEVQEMAMGRGWKSAKRRSEDVSERVIGISRQAEEERVRAQDEARIEEAARVRVAAQAGQSSESAAAAVSSPGPAALPPEQSYVPSSSAPTAESASEPEAVPPAPALSDPLALGVALASLLGSQPAQLLVAWQQAAVDSPGLSPSAALARAEQALESPGRTPR
jgi:hypothetical protein